MNNRQKAKHWKRLYEESLPKKPYSVEIRTLPLKHYTARYSIRKSEIEHYPQELLMNTIQNQLISQLKDVIKDHVEWEDNPMLYTRNFRFDFWLGEN